MFHKQSVVEKHSFATVESTWILHAERYLMWRYSRLNSDGPVYPTYTPAPARTRRLAHHQPPIFLQPLALSESQRAHRRDGFEQMTFVTSES